MTAMLALVLALAGSPLIDAARKAERDAVRALLQRGAKVNDTEADGTTALHWASYRDDLEIAGLLIRAGARVNAATDLGVTPLWIACENGSDTMVRRLLAAGAGANAALLSGETPLMMASRSGNAAATAELVAKGANVNARGPRNQTALMWAVAEKHAGVVKVLLAGGADVHARSDAWIEVQATSPHGILEYNKSVPHGNDTALMFAARVGDLESAKLLVAAGANVDDMDAWGVSATVLAAHSGYTDLVEFFLQKGANPNAAAAGFTALHEAIMRRDERMVSALLDHGADPNAPLKTWTPTRRTSRDWNFEPEVVGATPFWMAARFLQPHIMRLLAKHGADPRFVHRSDKIVDGRGGALYDHRREATNALMAAAGMGQGAPWVQPDRSDREALALEAVKIAYELGVDINAVNTDGHTALDAAKALKYESVVAFLAAKGAKPGIQNRPPAR